MPTASERLDRIRVKTERAKHHIRDLESRIKRFRDSDPYKIIAQENPQSPETVLRIKLIRKIPDDLSCIIGDAIHNLRSALDHLVWQLVEARGGTPTKDHCFPIYETSTKYISGNSARINGIEAGAVGLIDAAKPYAGGNDDLWIIHQLDILDKHRILLLAGFVNSGMEISITDESRKSSESRGVFWPNEPIIHQFDLSMSPPSQVILEYNTEIEFASAMLAPSKPAVDVKLKPTFDIAFADPQIVRGKPVIPFMQKLLHLVDGIVGQFLPFL